MATFSRAPRFQPMEDNGVPGPATYVPCSPESKKRGAFLEKDERFKDFKGNDMEYNGAYNPELAATRPRVVSTSLNNDNAKHRLDALRNQLTSQHVKEVQMLEKQIDKQSRKIADLELASADVERFKKDAKLLSTRESHARAELSRAQDQLALLPGLRHKFDALVSEHASSKEKHASATSAFKSQLSTLEKKLKVAQDAEAKLGAEGVAKTREVGRLGDELGRLRAQKGDVEQKLREKTGECALQSERREEAMSLLEEQRERYVELDAASRRQTGQVCKQASTALKNLKSSSQETMSALQIDNLTLSYQVARLERKLLEKNDQVAQLVQLAMTLEEEKAIVEDRAEDLEEEVEQLVHRLTVEEARHGRTREILEAQFAEDRQAMHDMHLEFRRQESNWHLERGYLISALAGEEVQVKEAKAVAAEMDELLVAKHELECTLEQTSDDLQASQDLLAEKDSELASKNDDLSALQSQHNELETTLSRTNAARATLEAELSNERDQRRRLAVIVSTTENASNVLRQQVGDLMDDLVGYAQLQETHEELLTALDRLMRTADLAEEDAKELARLNAQLAGHSNPSQKIRHLDRLRNELAGLKKQHVATQAELSAAHRQIEGLQDEVAAYKTVDGVPVKHLQASRAAGGLTSVPISSRSALAVSSIVKHPSAKFGNALLQVPAASKDGTKHVGRMSVSELR